MEKKIKRSQNPKEEPFIKIIADAIRKKEWSKDVTICDENENKDIEPEKCNKIIVNTKDGYEIIININNEEITGEVISVTKGEAEKYIVKFDANGAQGIVPAIERRKGFFIILPDGKNLTKVGEKLIGWSEKENPKEGEDKIYACGSSYQAQKEETTLYAIWAEDTITISFDNNEGEGQMESIAVISGKSIVLPNSNFMKEGYTFKEWNTKARRRWNKI